MTADSPRPEGPVGPAPAALRALIERYDGPGPRYTSYPPAPLWSDAFGPQEHRAALGRFEGPDVSVYVHVPFCESLCTYCACNREIHRDRRVVGPYLDALEIEAQRVVDAMAEGARCVQLALGGGTPTFLDVSQLERLLDVVDARFPAVPGAERSIEIDPRVTSPAQLELLARRGFNRISLGVQDLSPRVQQAIRRIQSREETEAIVDAARGLGFGSVNLDLIYGLPYQTEASFAETLEQVVAMAPDRIALYSYAHVTWVSKQQRGFERGDLPSPDEKVTLFLTALEHLGRAGYRTIGLDHLAKPDDELSLAADSGDLHRNFMGYTTRSSVDLVALGPSGISHVGGAYAQSLRSSAEWGERLAEGDLATLRGYQLDARDRRRAWLIQRLMCHGEIDGRGFEAAFGEPLESEIPDLARRLQRFVDDGLLVWTEERSPKARVTPTGRLFLRPMAMVLDASLESEPAGAPRYSRTV